VRPKDSARKFSTIDAIVDRNNFTLQKIRKLRDEREVSYKSKLPAIEPIRLFVQSRGGS